jgi:sporulation protein YlmC with PRC-barrel domain
MMKTAFMISTTALLMLAQPSLAQYGSALELRETQQTQKEQSQTQPTQKDDASKDVGREAPHDAQAQPGARTTSERLDFYTPTQQDIRGSDVIGMRVYNANNEHIGEIDDVILANGKDLKAYVIGVGGFLGVGERSIALEPGSITIEKTADGSERALVHATKENLEKAPALQRQARAQ